MITIVFFLGLGLGINIGLWLGTWWTEKCYTPFIQEFKDSIKYWYEYRTKR